MPKFKEQKKLKVYFVLIMETLMVLHGELPLLTLLYRTRQALKVEKLLKDFTRNSLFTDLEPTTHPVYMMIFKEFGMNKLH